MLFTGVAGKWRGKQMEEGNEKASPDKIENEEKGDDDYLRRFSIDTDVLKHVSFLFSLDKLGEGFLLKQMFLSIYWYLVTWLVCIGCCHGSLFLYTPS